MNATARHKIIVGVDYGTTFTGLSFVDSTKTKLSEIHVVNSWPNSRDATWKTPSKIAYAEENIQWKLKSTNWGFGIDPRWTSYSWTKLLLDKGSPRQSFDDPALKDLFGDGLMRLPPNKSAEDVCRDFLTELYHFMYAKLEKTFGREVLAVTPMECWITMPAIWSDRAQNITRRAACDAGFGSRPFDTICMITEPEAAALAALKPHIGRDAVDAIKASKGVL